IASARAAPRASSRSRHSFPVAECDTPRNAGGISMGNADAGSVMMLSADRRDGRRFNDSCASVATYTRHPLRNGFAIIPGAPTLFGEPPRMTPDIFGPSFETPL